MTAPTEPRCLDSIFDGNTAVIVPGAYDALSAKLVEEAGFPLVYVGSYGTAASVYGLADVGALTLDEMAAQARRVVDVVSAPVIADAENGFFDPPNIWRTVRAFEAAGVAAIHIEDHSGDKHTTLPQGLIPLEAMLQRLRAAMDARSTPGMAIIARTDAIWAMGDEAEALRRLRAFAATGIEYLFPTGADPAALRRLRREVAGRYVAIDLTEVRDPAQWDGAADLVIDYGFCLRAATKALQTALSSLRARAPADVTDAMLEPQPDFERRLGYAAYEARATRYRANE